MYISGLLRFYSIYSIRACDPGLQIPYIMARKQSEKINLLNVVSSADSVASGLHNSKNSSKGTTTLEERVLNAAKRKYGDDRVGLVKILPIPKNHFLRQLEYELVEIPYPKSRPRFFINTQSSIHYNFGSEPDKATVKIKKEEEIAKTQKLSLTQSTGTSVSTGATGGIGLSGPISGIVGISGNAGLSGNVTRTTKKQRVTSSDTQNKTNEEEEGIEEITVPPGTKVRTTMNTYLIRYDGNVKVDIKAPKDLTLAFKFLTPCQSCLPYCLGKRGFLTAADIFGEEPTFREEDPYIFYTADFDFTQYGKEIEVRKEQEEITET